MSDGQKSPNNKDYLFRLTQAQQTFGDPKVIKEIEELMKLEEEKEEKEEKSRE